MMNSKIIPYVLTTLLVVLGFSIFSVTQRLQNPQALQSNPYAQETSEIGATCSPKTSGAMCTGPGEAWETGSPADCMGKGGIPIGGDCNNVCCKFPGKMPWGNGDSCAGLKGSKEICEGFNSCPFNYMCKWDELTQTCGSAKAGQMANPWCPQPGSLISGTPGGNLSCGQECRSDSDCSGANQECHDTGFGIKFFCRNKACPLEENCTCPPTPTPLPQCGNGSMTAAECSTSSPGVWMKWYACACGNRGGCFRYDADPREICPQTYPPGSDVCSISLCEFEFCSRNSCGACYTKGQPAPTCPVTPAAMRTTKKTNNPSSYEIQNAGGLYQYQQNQ